jgi:hypothetical protein
VNRGFLRVAGVVAGIRLVYWLAVAVGLLWAPLRGTAISPFHAYDALGDLFFGAFAHWDSVWYIHIADHGYDAKQVTGFFPLYPLVVRALSHVFGSTVVAGTLVSLAAGAAGVAVVHRIARTQLSESAARNTVFLMALYPFAFVLTAVYSEGLFLVLTAGSFFAGTQRRPLLAGVLGGLAVATRLIGLALLPALLVLLWPRTRRTRDLADLLPLALLPAAAAAYAAYLHFHVGDALAYLHVQDVYWHHHTSVLGPLAGLWDSITAGYHGALEILRHLPRSSGAPAGFAPHDQWSSWNVVQLLLLVAAIWLTVVAWRRFGAAYGLYSAATIAIFLTSPVDRTPLVGSPRYLFPDFPLFMALATYVERRPSWRDGLLWTFAAVGGIAAVAFSRGVFVV